MKKTASEYRNEYLDRLSKIRPDHQVSKEEARGIMNAMALVMAAVAAGLTNLPDEATFKIAKHLVEQCKAKCKALATMHLNDRN